MRKTNKYSNDQKNYATFWHTTNRHLNKMGIPQFVSEDIASIVSTLFCFVDLLILVTIVMLCGSTQITTNIKSKAYVAEKKKMHQLRTSA